MAHELLQHIPQGETEKTVNFYCRTLPKLIPLAEAQEDGLTPVQQLKLETEVVEEAHQHKTDHPEEQGMLREKGKATVEVVATKTIVVEAVVEQAKMAIMEKVMPEVTEVTELPHLLQAHRSHGLEVAEVRLRGT